MKKLLFALSLMVASFAAMAQTEKTPLPAAAASLEPGIYIVDSNQFIPLCFHRVRNSGVGVGGVDITNHKIKGLYASQRATGTFLMVRDPKRRATFQTRRKQRVFMRYTTPENFTFLPLEQKKRNRLVGRNLGAGIFDVDLASFKSLPYTWEQVSPEAFLITIDFAPGQYALFFRPDPIAPISYMAAWDFYVE